MEGGFSKVFLMKKENGSEVIAKIPCHIAGPPTLTTAGEVGALEYSTYIGMILLLMANILENSQKTH
jgi:hypothetical protein